jgi:hypothetical protein
MFETNAAANVNTVSKAARHGTPHGSPHQCVEVIITKGKASVQVAKRIAVVLGTQVF